MKPAARNRGAMAVHASNRPSYTAGRAGKLARRVAPPLLLALVLGLSFLGWLSPDMKLQWENFMALCGF